MVYINNEEKIKNIEFNLANYYVVADFDKTLTKGTSDSTWGVMANANSISTEYSAKRKALYTKYRPIEIDMTITDEEKSKAMDEWWRAHINLFYEYNLNEKAVKDSIAGGGLEYREGAKEFINKMHSLNIPVIIISAGIGNVIEEFLRKENDYFDNIKIVSNFIEFENGYIKRIIGDTIHALNKNIISLDNNSKELLKSRDNILLLGDGVADLKMVDEKDLSRTISVGFLDEKIDENLEFYNKGFDIVITNQGSFEEVNKILNLY